MKKLSGSESIVVLTGAGISAESNLKTFRDHGGLWENHRVEEVASPEAFASNPDFVHRFYNERRSQLQDSSIKPNGGHLALAELEQEWPGEFLLVTQNVDNLHERAGSKNIFHMHGELLKVRNMDTDEVLDWTGNLSLEETPRLRPHIVWFGEMPFYMEQIEEALQNCDIFVSIGTSGNVYPAAGFVQWATRAYKIEVNLEPSVNSALFDLGLIGPATVEIPKLKEKILMAFSG